MSKKITILMLINFAIISLLAGNVVLAQAANREWNAGDIITWGRQDIVKTRTLDLEENIGSYTEIIARDEVEYNLTAIDTVQEEYDAYVTTDSGTSFINDRDFDAEDFVDDELNLGSFINPNYSWDYVNNVTRLSSFSSSLDLSFHYLLNPNWEVINQGFKDMLNGSELVDTLVDPYTSVLYNFTLNDFLGNASIKIMGRNSLSRALNQFGETTHKWSATLDLSGYIYDGNWNGTHTIYTAYEKYVVGYELEFTEGGILKYFKVLSEIILTIDDFQTEISSESKVERGNMKSVAASIPLVAFVGGLVSISAFVLIVKRRKR